MIPNAVCGVLLYEEAYKDIGDVLTPYVSEGPIGKYIYCKTAQENGSFLDMTFTPALCAETVKEDMLISVPLRYVRFMTTSSASLPMGFTTPKGKS
jgi:hypothetical protein